MMTCARTSLRRRRRCRVIFGGVTHKLRSNFTFVFALRRRRGGGFDGAFYTSALDKVRVRRFSAGRLWPLLLHQGGPGGQAGRERW